MGCSKDLLKAQYYCCGRSFMYFTQMERLAVQSTVGVHDIVESINIVGLLI